jgi:hypothetical protein
MRNGTIILRQIAWGAIDWIHMAQDREVRMVPVNTVTNHRVQ